jgi:hypothetical protein
MNLPGIGAESLRRPGLDLEGRNMNTPGGPVARAPALAGALAGGLILQACAEYRISVPDPDPIQLEGQRSEYVHRTMTAYLWGNILDPQVVAAECQGEGINDVVVDRTWQQDLISVLTLGIWMPSEVRYRCKAPATRGSVFPEPTPE